MPVIEAAAGCPAYQQLVHEKARVEVQAPPSIAGQTPSMIVVAHDSVTTTS
jgi:hypothetical protein